MKLGLYTITYLGLWYRGEALPLPQIIKVKNSDMTELRSTESGRTAARSITGGFAAADSQPGR